MVLTNPLSSKSVHRGDQIHAQTTNPIAIADQVVIPAGTFVQGTVDKLSRNGSRGEVMLQSAKFIFSDGYVANIAGPINVESDEGTAWLNPGNGTKAAMFGAPLAGLGLGALIGSAAHTTQSSTLGGTTLTSSTPKGLAIGSMVGLAAGGAVALAVFLHSHQFFVDVGSPMEMTLQQPVTLSQNPAWPMPCTGRRRKIPCRRLWHRRVRCRTIRLITVRASPRARQRTPTPPTR